MAVKQFSHYLRQTAVTGRYVGGVAMTDYDETKAAIRMMNDLAKAVNDLSARLK